MTEKNLSLWNRHLKPHDDAMRKAPKGLTAIDPMWTIREATLEWGPIGGAWGFSIINEEIVKSEVTSTMVHTVTIELWYPNPNGPDGLGKIQSCGGTTMDGVNKSGTFFNDDYAKMSVTDALSKALSWLGFGAAVHMGMFDGNKYIDFRPEEKLKEEKEKVTINVTPFPLIAPKGTEESLDELRRVAEELADKGVDKLGTDVYAQWHERAINNITGEAKLANVKNENALAMFVSAQREFIGKIEE